MYNGIDIADIIVYYLDRNSQVCELHNNTGNKMNVSQKCQYALRAVFELAIRSGQDNLTHITEVAQAQGIPVRFLEVILSELKRGGFVKSRRGVNGGYSLNQPAKEIIVSKIIRYIDGEFSPVKSIEQCRLTSFVAMWKQAQVAVEEVYDSYSIQDLVDNEQATLDQNSGNYCI